MSTLLPAAENRSPPVADDHHDIDADSDDEALVGISSGEGVELGYLDPFDKSVWNIFNSGKVGGRAVYLNPKVLPAPERLLCERCGKTMLFLIQIYAPLDGEEETA